MKIVGIDDINYPKLLRKIKNPPKKLYVMGNENLLNEKSVAVVGSRNMSEYGKKITKIIVKELSEAGICIVSGMAVGIDAVAHKTCLDYGGKTIAVLGCGFNKVFPPENVGLFNRILENGGCVISEYPINQIAQKKFFVQRNRIVSGLCLATLVVEATYRSGTSITANHALDQGRKLLCIPNSIGNKNSCGILNLMKKGAKIVTNAKDILSEIGIEYSSNMNDDVFQKINKIKEIEKNLLNNENQIVKNIYCYLKENGETNAEVLSDMYETDIVNINIYLSKLELKGLIVNSHGSTFRIRDDLYV